MRARLWAFGLSLLIYGTASAQSIPVFFGPLEIRNLRSLQMPFYRFTMRGASLEKDRQSWDFRWDQANDMRVLRDKLGTELLREDQETSRYTLTYRKGLRDGMEFGVEVPIEYRGGGVMDKMINWWHNQILRTEHPDRDHSPINQTIIRFPGVDVEGSAFGIGDVAVNLSKNFGHRLRAELALKLPTGNPGQFLGSGSPDGGLALDYTAAINSRWTAYFQGGVIVQGRSTIPGVRGLAHQENIALIWHPNSRDALVFQWNSEAAAIQTGIPFSDQTHRMLSLGYERALSKKMRLDLFFSEDKDILANSVLSVASIAPDLSVGAMLKYRF